MKLCCNQPCKLDIAELAGQIKRHLVRLWDKGRLLLLQLEFGLWLGFAEELFL